MVNNCLGNYLATPLYLETPLEKPLLFLKLISFKPIHFFLNIQDYEYKKT